MRRVWQVGVVAVSASIAIAACGGGEGEEAVELTNDMDRYSYAIGAQIGSNLKSTNCEVNSAMVGRAIKDVLTDQSLALDEEETREAIMAFQQLVNEARQAATEQTLAEGKAFLDENANKEGVVVLPSGLQYKVIEVGDGASPKATDTVRVNYRGTFIDGTEFDSSYKRGEPAQFNVKGVITGWTEALQLMKEGAKWQLFIPAELAYGPRGRPNIPPNSALVFEIELLEVVEPATEAAKPRTGAEE